MTPSPNPNLLDKASIDAEYRRYGSAKLKADENRTHNQVMHQRILSLWEQHSPQMWSNLQAQGLTDKMAFVAQQRMWDREKELLSQGFPITDAREIAEQEELLLEPETPMQDDSDLPIVLQDSPQNLKDRYREAMRRLDEESADVTPVN